MGKTTNTVELAELSPEALMEIFKTSIVNEIRQFSPLAAAHCLMEMEKECLVRGISFKDTLKEIPGAPTLRTYQHWKRTLDGWALLHPYRSTFI